MVREILNTKNPILRNISKPVVRVDKKIKGLISDLKETLLVQKDPEGVGLAAPQIGKNVRVFVMKPESAVRVIINPEVVKTGSRSKKEEKSPKGRKIMEGCLSLPNYYGPIKRKEKIILRYLNESGTPKTETFLGIEAQIIQHEIDHLNGTLFVDRLLEQKKPLYEYVNGEWEEVELV
ncbi:peptide deformylase [Candidatus Woesebacteria bacterium RIFCSPHIGHO2_01_FULL_39_17]|uniref:Peptide deformylase n=2 Tax=Candidatus Woeseibacteriota TaxID=1752722 RepID=A0A0G0RJ47_9BACT|nr:MAG: peptide deformylase [Microgenomates group bacterium GW2011_GWC1_38_12]KKQ93475.1 MAG: Peptide deformylase [Candidatus Woesebacteria bacterium GW2011_GWB1_39_10b]KKR13637.1 MAG: Peptide deformylase [Candidatus Woesebacteria bacterium GW2011_GWA1_39_21b]OGM22610.1 MAG: peptide deformylase [Candidatus Woesebacteria bacterium RIFCSPHIGHO2_01_FULL_39_17]